MTGEAFNLAWGHIIEGSVQFIFTVSQVKN